MDLKERFIPNMYDFCDRWCEKCKKCDRCMNYFLMEEMKARSETLPKEIKERKEGEDGWAHLKKMLGVAYKMLREVVKENGLNMEDVCGFDQLHRDMMKVGDLDKQEEEETMERRIQASDAIRLSSLYEHLADKCLKRVMELEGDIDPDTSPIADAEDTVGWYMELIQLKVWKALNVLYSGEQTPVANPYNGYAKVGLIAIRRSEEGWKEVAKVYNEVQEDVDELLIVLEEVEKQVVKEFPDAWAFKRPGLDDDEEEVTAPQPQ